MEDGPQVERGSEPTVEESTRRWMWVGTILMGLFFLAFPLYRWYEPAQRADAREEQRSFLAAQGGEIFQSDCESCHGVGGRGGLGPAIGAREFLELADDQQISELISLGVPGTEMVAYSIDFGGPMTSEEIEAVTAYIRSLEEDAFSNALWRTPLADQGLTAQDLYTLACARCHGTDRMGIEDLAPDISPTSYAMDESDDWLAGRIRDGYKDMPRWGGVLTSEQIDMLVSLLRGGQAPTTTTTVPPGTTTTVPGGAATTIPEDTTTTTEGVDQDLLALGEQVFQVTAGARGCQECHGTDAAGTSNGPNIRGVSKSAIANATTGGIPDMDDIELTPEELEAVYLYIRSLSDF